MALPSSGQISMLDIYQEKTGFSSGRRDGDDSVFSLTGFSVDGTVVNPGASNNARDFIHDGDINEFRDGSPNQTAPYRMSEFYGYSSTIHNTQFNVFYKSSNLSGFTVRYSGMWYDYPVSTSRGMFGSMTTPTFTGNYAGYNGTHTIAQMQTINSDLSSSQTSFVFQIHNGTGGTSSQSGGTAYSSNSGLTGIRVYNNSSYTGTPLIDLTLASASAANGWVGDFVNFSTVYYNARQWTWTVSASTYPQSTYFGTSTNTKYFQIY